MKKRQSNKLPQPSSKWLSHLTDEDERKEFNSRLLSSRDLFQRLTELVEIKKEENAKARTAVGSYDKPAWSGFQADHNGYERALTEVLDYLNFPKDI